ncbi:hypothetical protein HNY73_003699 [Argiope bruennichi]|uniref:Gustatory receptor n=1 Tax=Argiope bruennichi TaxID=94029 RepID=A0A8T0FRD7_ARGBR|nr:hypothetical protein HNY73_003699 [Argiope bruennichi]
MNKNNASNMQSNTKMGPPPLHLYYRLVFYFFRCSAITGFSTQNEKRTIAEKLLILISYIIIITQSTMIFSIITTSRITTMVVGWIVKDTSTVCLRYFLCLRAPRLGEVARRLSAINTMKDRRFNLQFNILVWSSIIYFLLHVTSMCVACYRSEICEHKSFFFGVQVQDPNTALLINELLSFTFILFSTTPVNTFTVYFMTVCHDIVSLFEAYKKHLTLQSTHDYQTLLQKHFSLRKLVLEIDSHISCIVFWASLNNAFSIYLAVYGVAEKADSSIELKILILIELPYNTFMLFFMCLWADRVSTSAASVAEEVHSLEENSRGSPEMHIRYLYLANRDVHLTVWGLFPLKKSFLFSALGNMITYTMLSKDIFKSE